MSINNIEIQDSVGNVYYPHTDASVVKFGNSDVATSLSDVAHKTGTMQTNLNADTVDGKHANVTPATTEKNDLVGMINELFTSVSNGKNTIYSAVTGKGITPASKNFADLTTGINNIPKGQGNATSAQILSGKTATVGSGQITGTMTNRGNTKFQICGYEGITECIPHPSDPTGQGLITGKNQYGNNGYIDENSQVQMSVRGLIPANIKAGITIGKNIGTGTEIMTGTFTSDATATKDQILSGYSAYVNGIKIEGTANVNITTTANASKGDIWASEGSSETITLGYRPIAVAIRAQVASFDAWFTFIYINGTYINIETNGEISISSYLTINDNGFTLKSPVSGHGAPSISGTYYAWK